MRTKIPSSLTSAVTFVSAAVCIGLAFYFLCIGAFENWLAMVSLAAVLALVASGMALDDESSPCADDPTAVSACVPSYSRLIQVRPRHER